MKVSTPTVIDGSPHLTAVTQHDTNTIQPPLIGLRFDAAGSVKIRSTNGETHTITALAGEYLSGEIDMVYDTDTALTNAQMIGFVKK